MSLKDLPSNDGQVQEKKDPFEVHHLFTTPVFYVDKILNHDKVQKELDDCIDDIDWNLMEAWGTTHYLSTQDFKEDIFKKHNLKALTIEMQRNMQQFLKILEYRPRPFHMENWFAKFERGNYGHIHNHGAADISGVYYYKTSGKDGSIFFESPNPAVECNKVFAQKCGGARRYDPQEGTMILFPGYLRHGIQTNDTDNTRISLSFNINFKQ